MLSNSEKEIFLLFVIFRTESVHFGPFPLKKHSFSLQKAVVFGGKYKAVVAVSDALLFVDEHVLVLDRVKMDH